MTDYQPNLNTEGEEGGGHRHADEARRQIAALFEVTAYINARKPASGGVQPLPTIDELALAAQAGVLLMLAHIADELAYLNWSAAYDRQQDGGA